MNPSLEEIISRADELYDKRAQKNSVRASLELLSKEEYEGDYEAAWRLSRAYFFLGQESSTSEEARAFHLQGVSAGNQAVRVDPSRVEGCFWLGVNLALLARLAKPMRALRRALRARHFLQRAVALNASYHGAGPLRVLARLQHKLPALMGGGMKRARANYEEAVGLAPANTVTRLYFAEMLMELGDEAAAHEQLESILSAPRDPEWEFESTRDRKLAREMLSNAKLKK